MKRLTGIEGEAGCFQNETWNIQSRMNYPIRTCVICEEEFELKPNKPGFANRCPECSAPEAADATEMQRLDATERKNQAEANEARRGAIRDLLYRKDS